MSNNKKIIAVFILLATVVVGSAGISLIGARYQESEANKIVADVQSAVANELTDPESARFKDVYGNALGMYCGEVNAKNKMGGYIGFQKFYASKGISKNWDVSFGKTAEVFCSKDKKEITLGSNK